MSIRISRILGCLCDIFTRQIYKDLFSVVNKQSQGDLSDLSHTLISENEQYISFAVREEDFSVCFDQSAVKVGAEGVIPFVPNEIGFDILFLIHSKCR